MFDEPPRPKYATYTTQYFKDNFAKILREMEDKNHQGAIITNHGRRIALIFPYDKVKG